MREGRLPKRFPAGTKYVVEGKSAGEGQVRIFSRYLVFPDGSCLDLPPDSQELSLPPAAMAITGQVQRRRRVAAGQKC
jgi:hypothetical protein